MIPSNSLFPHSIAQFIPVIVACSLITSLPISDSYAMSQKLDESSTTHPYRPAKWNENSDPEADAELALENNDHRLLAFALRATQIPGIEADQVNAYSEHCGIRFMKKFGDVIRSDDDLERMKQAREYALRYNAAILSKCNLSK
jgi:hypothetical protein